jgi:hypothetical protein
MRRPALTGLPLLSVAVAAVPVAAAMLIMPATPAHAASYSTTAYAARLLELVNDVRAQHGVRPLELAGGTTAVAAEWTQHLAAGGRLSHNPNLGHDLAQHGSKKWETYGENVGVGSIDDPDGLFVAYMNSPEHRANILDGTYRYVGVAVTVTGGHAWNTFDFVDAYSRTTTPAQQRVHRAVSQQVQRSSLPAITSPARPQALHAHAGQHSAPATVRVRSASTVRVEALHRTAPRLRATPHALGSTPTVVNTVAPHGSAPLPVPSSRRGAVLVAFAVLALCVAARRWVLVAAHR